VCVTLNKIRDAALVCCMLFVGTRFCEQGLQEDSRPQCNTFACFALFWLCVQVRKFVDEAYQRTVTIVEEKKEFLTAMSQCLLEKEVRGERGGGKCVALTSRRQQVEWGVPYCNEPVPVGERGERGESRRGAP